MFEMNYKLTWPISTGSIKIDQRVQQRQTSQNEIKKHDPTLPRWKERSRTQSKRLYLYRAKLDLIGMKNVQDTNQSVIMRINNKP